MQCGKNDDTLRLIAMQHIDTGDEITLSTYAYTTHTYTHTYTHNTGMQCGKNDDTLRLIALQDIDTGDEITLNYEREQVLLLPRIARQTALEKWFQNCACPRCQELFEDTRIFPCPKSCGRGVSLGYCDSAAISACNACGAEVSEASLSRFIQAEQSMDKKCAFLVMRSNVEKNSPGTPQSPKIHIDPRDLETCIGTLHFSVANIAMMLFQEADIDSEARANDALRMLEIYTEYVQAICPRLCMLYIENMQLKAGMLKHMRRYEDAMHAYACALALLKMWGTFSGTVVEGLVKNILTCSNFFDAKAKLRGREGVHKKKVMCVCVRVFMYVI
jgi:hypothetical protein